MDTSPEYIRMCKVAEIQTDWNPELGDWFWAEDFTAENTIMTVWDGADWEYNSSSHHVTATTIIKFRHHFTWLPRQDQLQEMIKEDDSGFKDVENIHCQFATETVRLDNISDILGLNDEYQYCKTWEQLWLAFVMWRNYQKRWDGKNWIYSK